MSRIKLDWLTAATDNMFFPDDVLPRVDWGKQQYGILHYQCQKVSPDTAQRFLYSPDVPGRGSCIVNSGSALLALNQSFNMSDDALVRHLHGLGFHGTRLDFALDLYHVGIGVQDFVAAYLNGAIRVPTRSFAHIRSQNGIAAGETLYFGSRESERYMRIYDKGLETGAEKAGEWLRVELELKGQRARAAFVQSTTFGTSEVGGAEIKAFMQTEFPFWEDALAGLTAPAPEIGERPITNRRRWLMGQVAQAIVNEIRDDPSFWETLGTWIGELRNQSS